MAQVNGRVERDCRHMENSLPSEIRSSTGARESFGDVGSEQLGFHLDSFTNLFFLYYTYCLFFA